MKETCEHVGREHPIFFQCTCCEDTADDCNCNYCPMVFCEKCQEMVMISCDDVVSAWRRMNPDKDMQLEKLKIQGLITGYETIYKQTKRIDE